MACTVPKWPRRPAAVRRWHGICSDLQTPAAIGIAEPPALNQIGISCPISLCVCHAPVRQAFLQQGSASVCCMLISLTSLHGPSLGSLRRFRFPDHLFGHASDFLHISSLSSGKCMSASGICLIFLCEHRSNEFL